MAIQQDIQENRRFEDSHSIPKKRGPEDPLSFAALHKEGIRLAQEMSGDVWTDYNLHDPGVTVLEQLCYALTELIYRSGLPVGDFLSDNDGQIQFDEQALHPPETILPCRPSTEADYQQLILDHCPDIENVWLEKAAAAGSEKPTTCAGIYKATARLWSATADSSVTSLNVRKVFAKARSLCEDIDVVVSTRLDCELHGTIELDGSCEPSDVLAQIYSCAVSYISSSVKVRPILREKNDSLVDLLTGPAAVHGRAKKFDAVAGNDRVLLAHLIGLLQNIDGVTRVEELSITVHRLQQEPFSESVARRHDNQTLWLLLPESSEQNTIRLLKNGKPIAASIPNTVRKFLQLVAADKSARTTEFKPEALYTRPRGQQRNLSRYFSIQNHFPDNYGINARGAPASATENSQAQTKQLKAYLMLFEQIMANHLANVDGVRELFARVGHADGTYRHQVLDTMIAGAEQLQLEPSDKFIKGTLADFDDKWERKSRQLDHMLAVFGESLSQKSLRHFDYYAMMQSPNQQIVKNKAAYLDHIVDITRDRIAGFDYFNPEPVSGFARRIGLILGFHRYRRQPDPKLTARLVDAGIKPVCRDKPTQTNGNEDSQPVKLIGKLDAGDWRESREILKDDKNASYLLAFGCDLKNYRLQASPYCNDFTLEIAASDNGAWHALRSFDNKEQGSRVANALRYRAIGWCHDSEGLHIVEHVLLRPASGESLHRGLQPCGTSVRKPEDCLWKDFYPLRFSVFFPNWTARCRDPAFQALAEETVRINSPAHVYSQCFWLNFEEMSEFEQLHANWTDALARLDAKQKDEHALLLDDSAVRLIDFVIKQKEKEQRLGHGD